MACKKVEVMALVAPTTAFFYGSTKTWAIGPAQCKQCTCHIISEVNTSTDRSEPAESEDRYFAWLNQYWWSILMVSSAKPDTSGMCFAPPARSICESSNTRLCMAKTIARLDLSCPTIGQHRGTAPRTLVSQLADQPYIYIYGKRSGLIHTYIHTYIGKGW